MTTLVAAPAHPDRHPLPGRTVCGSRRLEGPVASLVEIVPSSVVGQVLRGVFALPGPVKRLIAGAPVRRDGQRLSVDAQLLLTMMRLEGEQRLGAATVEAARQGLARS